MIGPLIAGALSSIIGRQAAKVTGQAAAKAGIGTLGKIPLVARAQRAARKVAVRLTRRQRPPKPGQKPRRPSRVPAGLRSRLRTLRGVTTRNQQPQIAPNGGVLAPLTPWQRLGAAITGRTPTQQPAQQGPMPPGQGPPGGPVAGGIAGRIAAGAGRLIMAHPVAAGAILLTGVFAGLVRAGKRLADAQLEHQKRLTAFNAQIAVAYARLNRGDLLRNRSAGNATAGTTEMLANAINDFRDTVQPFKNIGNNIVNVVGTGVYKLLNGIMFLLGPIKTIADWCDKANIFKGERKRGPWEEFFINGAAENQRRHAPKKKPHGPAPGGRGGKK